MSKVRFPLPEPSDREPTDAELVAEILGRYFTAGEIRDGLAEGGSIQIFREGEIDDAVMGADHGFEGWDDDEEWPR